MYFMQLNVQRVEKIELIVGETYVITIGKKDESHYEKFKPLLKDFIKFYYEDLGNVTGGYLHVVLDDGNLGEGTIYSCQTECEEKGDTFGYFLATLLRLFTEDKLQEMYDADWQEIENNE